MDNKVMVFEEGMDENVVMGFGEEHDGKKYEYPIGVLAENVKTNDDRMFISKKEKEKISNLEKAFQDGCNVLVSTCTTYGATPKSNSPAHIADAIGLIYKQGQKDVIADPAAYGIKIGYSIDQLKVGISTHDWADYDAYSKCFTAPNDGILVVGNTVHAGIGVLWGAEGTHEISVIYKGEVILAENVNVHGGPDGYAKNNPHTIISNQQFPLKAGEQLIIKAKFTGSWMTDEDGSHISGTTCSFGGDSALTWVHIFSEK